MVKDLPWSQVQLLSRFGKRKLGEGKRLVRSPPPPACWWQSVGLIQVPGPQDRAGSVINLRSCVCARPPHPTCSPQREASEDHRGPSLFAEPQSSLTTSPNLCSAPSDLIGPAPRGAPHLAHPQTASVCTGAPGGGAGAFQQQVDNGWVKRVVFFSHLLIPRVCKSLSQATQSRQEQALCGPVTRSAGATRGSSQPRTPSRSPGLGYPSNPCSSVQPLCAHCNL